MAPPSKITAVVTTKSGTAETAKVQLPALRDDYVLVRTTAVALNPVDWKRVKGATERPGHRLGCDFAGIVEEVGRKVTKPFARGDRICGVVNGGNPAQSEDGSFAEYIVAKGDLSIKIPDNISDEEAATLGVGITTVGQGLYQSLKLPLPQKGASTTGNQAGSQKDKPLVFISGGSTATGILGIQFAALSGYTVLTTGSAHNFEYLKSLGASLVVDYHSPSAAQDVKDWIANNTTEGTLLTSVWDCIGGAGSSKLCAAVLANPPPPGVTLQYGAITGVDEELIKSINPSVTALSYTLAFTALGEPLGGYGPPSFSDPKLLSADFEFGKMFWELSRELLADETIKPARLELNRGGKGLEGVPFGLKELEQGNVSGVKLVYTL